MRYLAATLLLTALVAAPAAAQGRWPGPSVQPGRPGLTAPYDARYGGRYAYFGVTFDKGYFDGYEKGWDDARDRDRYDIMRHRWYRSGDRGYDRRYGPKETYRYAYRQGFEAGYAEGYRGARGYGPRRGGGEFYLRWR